MGNCCIQLDIRPSPNLCIASFPCLCCVLSREKLAQRRDVVLPVCSVCFAFLWCSPAAGKLLCQLIASPLQLSFFPSHPACDHGLADMASAPGACAQPFWMLLRQGEHHGGGLVAEASCFLAAATLLGVHPSLSPPHPWRDWDVAELSDSDASAQGWVDSALPLAHSFALFKRKY